MRIKSFWMNDPLTPTYDVEVHVKIVPLTFRLSSATIPSTTVLFAIFCSTFALVLIFSFSLFIYFTDSIDFICVIGCLAPASNIRSLVAGQKRIIVCRRDGSIIIIVVVEIVIIVKSAIVELDVKGSAIKMQLRF